MNACLGICLHKQDVTCNFWKIFSNQKCISAHAGKQCKWLSALGEQVCANVACNCNISISVSLAFLFMRPQTSGLFMLPMLQSPLHPWQNHLSNTSPICALKITLIADDILYWIWKDWWWIVCFKANLREANLCGYLYALPSELRVCISFPGDDIKPYYREQIS